MAKETCTPVGNCQSFKGESAKYLPKKTLYYFGPGHTDGDAIVVFPAVRVAHFADIFSRKTLPNIMPADGGSAVSLPQTLAKAVAGLKDVDRVISGHSHLFSWQELEEFAILQRDFLTMVQDAMRAGQDVDAMTPALVKALSAKYKDYTITDRKTKVNAGLIYDELNRTGRYVPMK
jgi:glyoxylase-like metal-dependent hydrolase (beta-lactamase superfamily II)